MKILDFDLDGNHFIIEADAVPFPKVSNRIKSLKPRRFFQNVQVYKEVNEGILPFQIKAVSWYGRQLTPYDALKDIIGRISRNETGKLTVQYICPQLKEYLDEFKKYPAITGERTIPYFIFHNDDIARLGYATNEFLYYVDRNDMPLMFHTDDGTIVADNEFANIGLFESEENVENGTETLLAFTEYPPM